MSISEYRVLIHDSREAKISKLDIMVGVEEDVAWFEVTMENFSLFTIVAGGESLENLTKYRPYYIFWNGFSISF